MNTPQLLSNLQVLDITTIISGGTTTSVLADFGAEVIKVEHPDGGDPLRSWGPLKDGVSLWWKVLARNKKSITLNLRERQGQALLMRLAERADVVVENFRPGTLERWDLGYEALRAANPGIILTRISGFGQTGPYRDRPGFGTVAEAMSGLVAISGHQDGPPLLPPLPLADEIAGLFGAFATVTALNYRDRHGQGQVVDVSLYEPLFRLLIPDVPQYLLTGEVPRRIGNRFAGAAPRNLYPTADERWLAISATTQRVFERLAATMGRSDLVSDPRFIDNAARTENVEALDAVVQEWTSTHSLADLERDLREAGAVAGPVYDVASITADPQYEAREDIVMVADPEIGSIPMPGIVPKFSLTPGRINHAGPRLGQHNHEIYGQRLGMTADEVAKLRESRIV